MKESEKEIGHERLTDCSFKIPAVEGMGAGAGFQLKNLALPENYEDLIGKLDAKINISDVFSRTLEIDCRHFYLPQGFIEFKNNLLSQIVFGGLGESPRVFLDENRTDYETGMETYQFENVKNIQMAMVLAKTISEYMNFLLSTQQSNEQYGYVDYFNNGSRDVFFPII